MAKLRVTLHGQNLTELHMEPGNEYYAGRASQSHILLSNQRGISRQHVKFFHDGNSWVAQLVSKYGGMIHDGQSVEMITMVQEARFSIPPYEFHFYDNGDLASSSPANLGAPEGLLTAPSIPTLKTAPPDINTTLSATQASRYETQIEDVEDPAMAMEDSASRQERKAKSSKSKPSADTPAQEPPAHFESTIVASAPLTAFIKIVNHKTGAEEVLKLDGNMWTVGRQPSCEVVIEDSAISRKHFDLIRTTEGYFISDHGSANGTRLNGEKITPQHNHRIQSGDILKVRHVEITFELRDTAYMNQLAVMPANSTHQPPEFQSGSYRDMVDGSPGDGADSPAVLRIPPSNLKQRFLNLPRKMQIGFGVGFLIIFYGLFFTGSPPPPQPTDAAGTRDNASVSDFEKLTPDKKNEVVDTFNLAQNYYVQRKYVLCLSQVEKLHNLVAFHSNSKELESLCRQAQELEQIELDRRRKEEARAEAENAIRRTVEDCRAKVRPDTTSEQLNTCLQAAIELDPQHGLITDLQSQVLMQENAAQDKNQKLLEQVRRKQVGQALYSRAVGLQRAGQLKSALQEYKKFVSGRYPGLNQEDDEAQRSISSISKTLAEQVQQQVLHCQTAYNSGNLKGTITACEKALRENPGQRELKSLRDKAFSQLQREMKTLYEDSRIEESLGNIEAAKEKWQRIVEKSVPQESYYQKAKKSLRKYGL